MVKLWYGTSHYTASVSPSVKCVLQDLPFLSVYLNMLSGFREGPPHQADAGQRSPPQHTSTPCLASMPPAEGNSLEGGGRSQPLSWFVSICASGSGEGHTVRLLPRVSDDPVGLWPAVTPRQGHPSAAVPCCYKIQ